ncbi:uncharacterized protein C8Q71DRAFT_757195 [Rhodofomes roseus]|uniref:T6SS Phospholipase effector Tle1-like catalytic domain-containing protein n=1 Tax=Rhodofomes roseus TaxID=34475 RepID=A0ABQ8KH90_9APHY|nr:uncharacterized protein C8Q71DRAFT_757195 [Rhodofomes roseus]KAH9837212.1 hypothetical protein C8Q71DRAFT_757195 [Rhodofomes roseus]
MAETYTIPQSLRPGHASEHASVRRDSAPTMSSGKRLIVCCDGTWQDGIVVNAKWKYTNVLRLARTIRHSDERLNPPVAQIVFYQSGIGSAHNLYSEVIDGTTGASLGDKLEEAYSFLAQNYHPGDEIFLFGFSRGAYTARTIASLIGDIGVLDRTEMDHFAEIFVSLQKRAKSTDPDEIGQLDAILAPWTGPQAPGMLRTDHGPEGFSVKCVGVFETVGSVGLPEELTLHSEKTKNLLGFRDKKLGPHVERACHALALNEPRADFDCAKFEQTEAGRRKGQILKQCWFTGCHSDVGGGYQQHDLSDLTLTWMAANIGDMLDLNLEYLMTLPQPVKPWGQLPPHDPLTGVYSLAKTIQRKLPTVTDDVTHETVHLSVLEQPHILPELAENIQKNPRLICALLPLEEELRHRWHVAAENASAQAHAGVSLSEFVMAAHHEGSGHRVVSEAKKWVDFAVDNSTAAVMKHLLR